MSSTHTNPVKQRFTLVAAVHLFLVREGWVLLSRRCGTGYEDGNYSVVAGHLEGGESLHAAMIREAREETGIALAPGDLTIVGAMHRRSSDREQVDFFLVAAAWAGEPENREPDKCDDLRWFPLDAPPENTVPYVRRALDNYRAGCPFDLFGWEDAP